MIEITVYLIACVLVVLTGLIIINILTFPRLKQGNLPANKPLVSILIPARNEGHIIQETVQHILSQTYTNYELIVLDDNSTDDTVQILTAIDDNQLTVIKGSPLPVGWMGKNWACHQLSQHARGDILIFTDADVKWSPDGLTAILTAMQHHNADLFTVWPTQHTITSAERLTVPLMAFAILTYLPAFMTHHSPFSVFAAANGQCMAWKRRAYEAIGGHAAVAGSVLEDVNLAQIVKKKGYKLRMADGNNFITCRMYDGWKSVRDGFAKNMLAGYGNSIIALFSSIVFHVIVFLSPVVLFVLSHEYRLLSGLFIVQAMLIRALSASFTHQRKLDAIGMPLSVLLMTLIALRSILWHFTGGSHWKGRRITTNLLQGNQHNG